jgi:hypothetical protein
MKLAADMFRQAGKDADRAAIEFRKQVRKNKKEKKEKDAAETKNLLAVAKIFSVAEKSAKNKNKAQANKLKIRTSIEKTLNRIITFKSVFGAQLFQNTVEFELDEVYPETRELDFTTAPNTPRSSSDNDSMVQEIVQAFDEVQSHDEIVQAYNELIQASKEQEDQEDLQVVDGLQVFDEQEELFIFDEEELRVFDEQEEIIQAVKELQVVEEKEELQVVEEKEELQVVEEKEELQVVEEKEELQVVEEKEELQVVEEKEELQVVEEKEKAGEELVPKSRRSKAPIVVREYTLRSHRTL